MAEILLSLKPRFAQAILAHDKTVDVRRRAVRLDPGDLVYLYSTAPIFAVVGFCRVSRVEIDIPQRLFRNLRQAIGLKADEYGDYMNGSGLGSAIYLEDVNGIEPVSLAEIRIRLPRFVVPQSYRRLAKNELEALAQARRAGKRSNDSRTARTPR